jgi:hypothetical protein
MPLYKGVEACVGLSNIFQQVFASFEADAQADDGVGDGYRGALSIGKEAVHNRNRPYCNNLT